MGILDKLSLLLKHRDKYPPYKNWDKETVKRWEGIRVGYVYKKEEELFKQLLMKEELNVLDLACGSGRYTEMLNSEKYVGLDFSPAMLKLAKQRYPENQFILADAFHLPFKEEVFNQVFASRFIHHHPDLRDFYHEVSKVLFKNGVFIFDITHKLSLPYILARILNITLYARKQHGFTVECNPVLALSESITAFFLPSVIYSLIPENLSRLIDKLFSKIFPSRSFCRMKKR